MNLTDYIVGWTVVNFALAAGILAAVILWTQYQMQVERWRARHAPEPEPAPESAPAATPRREERSTPLGWLVVDDGMGAHAPTREEANDLLDRCLAIRADERVLEEVAEAFHRQGHA